MELKNILTGLGKGNHFKDEVKNFFLKSIKNKTADFSLNEIVNSLIKQDIEISKKLVS